MTTTIDRLEALISARDFLRDRNWKQGSPGKPNGGPCSLDGALHLMTQGEEDLYQDLIRLAAAMIARRALELGDTVLRWTDSWFAAEAAVVAWNDSPGRTVAEVHELLDALIADEEQELVA